MQIYFTPIMWAIPIILWIFSAAKLENFINWPNGMYDLVMDEVLADADKQTARKVDEN